jgi:hypothetical protein
MNPISKEALQPYYSVLGKLKMRLQNEKAYTSDWDSRVFNFPEDVPTMAAFTLFKRNWLNDVSSGVHFESWFGNADIERQAFPIALHVEATKADTGLVRGVFTRHIVDQAGDKIASWDGYTVSPKSYQLFIARLPFSKERLVDEMLAEFLKVMELHDLIDQAMQLAVE